MAKGTDTKREDGQRSPRLVPADYDTRVKKAVAFYWTTLLAQSKKQKTGDADRGGRQL